MLKCGTSHRFPVRPPSALANASERELRAHVRKSFAVNSRAVMMRK